MHSKLVPLLLAAALAIACQGCDHDITVGFEVTDATGAAVPGVEVGCFVEYLPDGIEGVGSLTPADLTSESEARYACTAPDDADIVWATAALGSEAMEYGYLDDDIVPRLELWQPRVTVSIDEDALVVAWDVQPTPVVPASGGADHTLTVNVAGVTDRVDLPATEVRLPLDQIDDPLQASITIDVEQGRLYRRLDVQ